jgi:hypothetical protein
MALLHFVYAQLGITYDRYTTCGKEFKNGEGRYLRLDKELCVTCHDASLGHKKT